MAKPSKQQTEDILLEVGKWTDGVVNARPGKDIPKTALQDAQNVDISDAGTVRRRKGTKLVVGGTNCHSVSGNDDCGLFFADGITLQRAVLSGASWAVSAMRNDLEFGSPLFWVESQGYHFYSNGKQYGKIHQGEHLDWAVESPSAQPTITANGSGNLAAGRYGIAVAFVNNKGEEGGTMARVHVDVLANGRIALTNIPQPVSNKITKIRVYATDANGTVPYKLIDLPLGTYTWLVSNVKNKGMPLVNELTDVFPACKNLAVWRGYMLGTQDNVLYVSEPQRFGVCQLQSNFHVFPETITAVAAVEDGFYVVADKTYFISGGTPDKWDKREVLPYGGAVPGTIWKHPTEVKVGWFTDKGQIIARNSGELKNETIDKVAPKKYSSGAAFVRREDGIEQIVNSFPEGGSVQAMGASSFTDAEIIRAQVS